MIKRKIEYDYHIEYKNQLNNTNYLFCNVNNEYEENEMYDLYETKHYLLELDNEMNVCNKKYLSSVAWYDLVYYSNKNFIFKSQEMDGFDTYEDLDGNRINVQSTKHGQNFTIIDDKCYVFSKDKFNPNYMVYNNKLEPLDLKDKTYQEMYDSYRDIKYLEFNEKVENILPKYSIIYYNDEEIITSNKKYQDDYEYIVKLDNNFNIVNRSKIKIDSKSSLLNSFIRYNDFYYVSYYIRINKYLIIKMSLDFEIIEEEYVNTYRCDFIIMNNQICAIIDEPRRYSSKQKKYKNQKLMGNSSILILD